MSTIDVTLLTLLLLVNTLCHSSHALGFSSHGYGSVNLHNHCPMVIYVTGVQQTEYLKTQIPPKDSFSILLRESFGGFGNSIKLATNENAAEVLQLEYSACFEPKNTCFPAQQTYWDLSKINGDPFPGYGVNVIPSYPSCAAVTCAAGVEDCKFVYYQPDDNEAVRECDSRSDLNVYLCQ